MKVNVIGGGPGGLYASALIKKRFPDWSVDVYERDPADNTYGWGVVFSDATLSNLREADAETHERITDAFAHWDPIDVHYDGEYFRCGGHSFAGIMRADLLAILQERCEELGVGLHHGVEVEDPGTYREEADLLIGADGLNSTIRERYADEFGPDVTHGSAKFAWFGTEKPFDVFTFVFRENEHGLWRVHAYPGRKSTFIVECTEDTWRAAGMDDRDEADAMAYFEDLFADHLDGYDLLEKLYAWRTFPVVECDRWSFENVVLLGDAAHTAHFTIGSGTKLAMEDAIGLADAVREHGTDLPAVLNWYEKERRPRVEGLQAAAERSRKYFENVERYHRNLRPRRFAFNLLTRSGRISYESLKNRDPGFTDDFDRWFDRVESGADAGSVVAAPPMFEPFHAREVTVPNRAVLYGEYAEGATDGRPSADYLDRFRERCESGAGLALTDPVAVTANGRITPGTPGIYDDDHRDAWADALADVERDGSGAPVAGITLVHAGRRGATRSREHGLDRPLPGDEAWTTYAPSAKPYAPGNPEPEAMDDDDLERVREAFVAATERADDAGFDWLEVHAGRGYLLSSFLSPLTNERDDEYGGSLEDRARYPLEVYDAVRAVWPDGKPVGVTLQATDWNLRGFTSREATRVAGWLADRDCDLVTVVAGGATVRERPQYDPTTMVDFTDKIRNEAGIPAMSTSYATTFDDVNTLVGAGRADLCAFYPGTFDG